MENQDNSDQDDQDGDQPLDDAFMGAVGERNPWVVTLKLNGTLVKFCIDTGAEATVISEQIHNHAGRPFLNSSDRTLKGPDAHCLPVKGYFIATLQWGIKETRQRVYVVERLNKPLLGRPAIEKLGLLMRIGAIDQDTSSHIIRQFPLLFEGLGKLQGEYRSKLQKGATPYALTCPRIVALPLLKPVEQELRRMEELGVIAKVDHPTDWCAGMVVVPKTNGRVRMC